MSDPSAPNITPLITAQEAFIAFEQAVLSAQSEVVAGFRIFDLTTPLVSDAARAVGDTWADLLLFKLRQGITFDLTLSDFDPVVGTSLHAKSVATLRAAIALQDVLGPKAGARLRVRIDLHPARVATLTATALWPRARKMVCASVDQLNSLEDAQRSQFLRDRIGLRPLLCALRERLYRARLWPPARLAPATHHQKLAVIDARQLYIGGLDLNARRYDTPQHDRAASQTWHDVQLMVDDPALAAAARTHLLQFRAQAAGTAPITPAGHPQFLRTLSKVRRAPLLAMSPKPAIHEIADTLHAQIAQARHMIYIETQYFRDTGIAKALARAARNNADLRLVMVLPAAPDDIAFGDADGSDVRYGEYLQAKCVDRVQKAFGARAAFLSPVQQRDSDAKGRAALHGAPLIYVHAKVAVFDDRAAIVSSANLNGRSLKWDTEAGVLLNRASDVAMLMRRCTGHWLHTTDPDPRYSDPTCAAQALQAVAQDNAGKRPKDRTGFLVPYKSEPGRRIGRPLPGVPEELV